MIRETRALVHEGDELVLDPFAFWPDRRSRFVGLGGEEEGDDPDYAFHTLYAACGSGPIVFTVKTDGLKAQRGTLIMRVHELPEVMGAHAQQVAISQTQLVEMIRGDGTASLAAMARQGSHYALLGHVYGDTVASVRRLAIDVARRRPDPHDPGVPTLFRAGKSRVGSAAQVIGEREGSMVTPVSQLCTANQVTAPVVEAVLRQMGGLEGLSPVTRWEHAFLARVLDRYDVARSGARGLGIGAVTSDGSVDPIARWIGAHGCSLVLTCPVLPSTVPDLPPHADLATVDPMKIEGPAGFDFAWATRAGGIGGEDRQLVLQFVEDALRTLKPGGLLALVVPVDVALRPIGEDDGPMIRRSDLDRIALVLLARGHQVAQLCPWGDPVVETATSPSQQVSAFGLVVRRAA